MVVRASVRLRDALPLRDATLSSDRVTLVSLQA